VNHLISCQNLSKSFAAHTLFTDISLGFNQNDKIGLVGPNGSGKSTLLKIMAGLEAEDHGTIFRSRQTETVYLSQEDDFEPGRTVDEIVAEALMDEDDEAVRYNKSRRALSQAGFKDLNQTTETLSGGWRKKLAIARAMAQQPDLLFLDEPTNHLDIEAILLLENLLQNASFAFVLISHDRTFLENVTNRTIELNRCYPDGFFNVDGSYSYFLEQRTTFLNHQQEMETRLSNKVRREVEWLRRGPKARTTKARYRIDEAHRLQDQLSEVKGRNRAEGQLQLGFAATGRKTKKLLQINKISKSLGGRLLFSDLSFELTPGSRLGLAGGNGCGKSTLIKTIHNDLEPDSGTIKTADGIRIVLFDQKREQLDQSLNLRQALAPDGDSILYQDRPLHVVSWAKRFLFDPDQLDMPISRLSGGEQARILIANLMRQPADILLLDEPTNDLDINSIEILEDSLQEFKGAIILVSHDRSFLNNMTDAILGFDGRGATSIFADYQQWISSSAKKTSRKSAKKAKGRPAPAKKKKLSFKEEKELAGMEEAIMMAEEKLAEATAMVEDPAIMANPGQLTSACASMENCQAEVDTLYLRWDELEAKKEELANENR